MIQCECEVKCSQDCDCPCHIRERAMEHLRNANMLDVFSRAKLMTEFALAERWREENRV